MARPLVYLINPPSLPGTLANREGAAGLGVVYSDPAAFCYPPHTLAAAAATLRKDDWPVQVFDGIADGSAPDWQGAAAMGVFVSFASLPGDLEYLHQLRAATSARVLVFGPSIRFVAPEVFVRAGADAVLIGDAEGYFHEVMRRIVDDSLPTNVVLSPATLGLPGYDDSGLLEDLDSLPFPAWDRLPWSRYGFLTIMGSRGCPDHCSYCPYAASQGHRLRARSVRSVVAEMQHLVEAYRPSRLIFRDPVFAYQRDRVVGLCEEILRLGLRVNWECESRPEHFDRDVLRLMQRAGCKWVKIGLETTDASLLQSLRRVASHDQAEQYLAHIATVVEACRRAAMNCRVFVMTGLPGQNDDMVLQTARFVQQMGPDALNIKECESYPGIELSHLGDAADARLQTQVLQEVQQELVQRSQSVDRLTRVRRWLRQMLRGDRCA